MREHYGKETQKHIDSDVDNAVRREAELVASIQAGVVDLVLRQQLEQVRREAECARQEVENWKGNSTYWEDQAAQAEARAEELARRLAASGDRSGAETLTFAERCASQQRDAPASFGLHWMFASVSPAPFRAPISDASKPSKLRGADKIRGQREDDDEILRSVSSDDEDGKRNRVPLKPLVLDPIPNA